MVDLPTLQGPRNSTIGLEVISPSATGREELVAPECSSGHPKCTGLPPSLASHSQEQSGSATTTWEPRLSSSARPVSSHSRHRAAPRPLPPPPSKAPYVLVLGAPPTGGPTLARVVTPPFDLHCRSHRLRLPAQGDSHTGRAGLAFGQEVCVGNRTLSDDQGVASSSPSSLPGRAGWHHARQGPAFRHSEARPSVRQPASQPATEQASAWGCKQGPLPGLTKSSSGAIGPDPKGLPALRRPRRAASGREEERCPWLRSLDCGHLHLNSGTLSPGNPWAGGSLDSTTLTHTHTGPQAQLWAGICWLQVRGHCLQGAAPRRAAACLPFRSVQGALCSRQSPGTSRDGKDHEGVSWESGVQAAGGSLWPMKRGHLAGAVHMHGRGSRTHLRLRSPSCVQGRLSGRRGERKWVGALG